MSKRSGIMLCYPLEERRLLEPKFGWRFPVLVQPKMDGERARPIPHLLPEEHFLISSECNPIISVPHINSALKEQGITKEVDGELYNHGMDWAEIHSIVSRKKEETIHPNAWMIKYYIFDYVAQDHQLYRAVKLIDMNLEDPLIHVPTYTANDLREVMYYYDKFKAEGYEGIIVRHIDKFYIRKRSRFILKFKPKKVDDYEVTSLVEAVSKDGKPLGMVGAIWCRGDDEEIFKIGAGHLKHDQRRFYWHNPDEIVGHWCRVEYQHLMPKTGVPRFGLALEVLGKK